MRTVFDSRLYGTKHGGIGRYTKELIKQLLKIDQKNQYVFLVYSEKDAERLQRLALTAKNDRIKTLVFPYRWYTFGEQWRLPRLLKKMRPDLVHFPHFNVPIHYHGKFIVTIHDLIIHHFPDERATTLPKWLYQIKLAAYHRTIKHAVRGSEMIIVPSEFTKQDISRFYPIDPEKIKVIYEAPIGANSKLEIQNSKLQLKIKNLTNYILYVGSAYPHKNLERLIAAFKILKQKNNSDLQLVLVGKIDYFYQRLHRSVNNNLTRLVGGQAFQQFNNDIIFYGHASDCELTALYQKASLFVFPSLHEGFGLPPLEAMSHGLPVVAANATCVPEICGNAAIYFDPADVDDMAAKIWQVYQDKNQQEKLRQFGFEQIKKYSWDECARETLQIYERSYKAL